MAEKKHYETAPEDRISFFQKLVYGIGGLVNNLLAAAFGTMTIILNLGLGMNPAIIGTLMSISRFSDAFTDPVMGYVSDHTRSRFGRRRPYIFVGAILSGLIFAWMWQLQPGRSEHYYFWFLLVAWNLFYLAYTVYATPWVGLGYELTPDYHERTRLMGYSTWIGQFAWVIAPWFYKIMENRAWFPDSVVGAQKLAIMIGIFVAVFGALPALFLRERQATALAVADEKLSFFAGLLQNLTSFFKGFFITLKNGPFRNLCAATFLVFNGFMMVSAFSSYVIIYYVFGGDKGAGATYMGWFGLVSSIATFCIIPLVTWMSSRLGKKKTFVVAMSISILGYLLKIVCYKPGVPMLLLLPAPLIAFGLGSLFTLMGAMIADVCDLDELDNGKRREGSFGAIYWWNVKLGMALAFAISGHLLNLTGFDVALEANQTARALLLMRVFDIGVPIVATLIAIIAVATYPITEQKAHDIRAQLEKRRGKLAAA